MKRAISIMLCLALLFALPACGEKEKPTTNQSADQPTSPNGKTTLMIYMVGSDLEAKGGAGTNDMQEMIESQVDLSINNVVVYAGGSRKWHNDTITAESGHAILQLSTNGFKTLETRSEASMGEAETLSYFLNYSHKQFAADHYALILWDHGNGPLIGYGKDMLHEDDSLTLLEMRSALKSSPFSGKNKLDWVGFDACLMSSVELACIWQDHAEYLIASQEIEPSFGWNYSFLKNLGKKDTKTLSADITKQYMDSCLKYYERRNFDQRDTTLACMNLSQLSPLKNALESLFKKANADIATEYTTLVSNRVNTRALGRATTGSEYDLIDVVDLAEQMKQRYPDESAAIVAAAKKMVVHNVTNTIGCCGLSLYYPFYNKSYYEKAWGDVYQKLNVLPAYTSYLENYAHRWLQNDLLQSVATSITPHAVNSSEFKLELTADQAANFADASYYILQREGNQLYTRLFTSSNVVKSNNELTANFDGNILYAKNKFDQYWIPVVDEHDTVGDHTRFSTYVNLTNAVPVIGEEPDGYQQQVAGHRFHISVNNTTKQITTAALVPYDADVQTETLTGGKQEDADLSAWSQYYFLQNRHLYLQRDDKGVILPLNQWEKSPYLSANTSRVDDGIEFVLAPIPQGEYYVMFEIEDVQGSRYCSELLPIQSQGASLPIQFEEKPATVTWQSGDKVKLFTQENVTVYLTTLTEYDATRYIFHVENHNDFDIAILGNDLMFNNSVYCSDGGFGGYVVPAGQTLTGGRFTIGDITTTSGYFRFGAAEDLKLMSDLRSIQFHLTIVTATGDRTLIYQKPVHITLSEYAAGLRQDPPDDSFFSEYDYVKTNQPAFGLQAKEQTLFYNDGVRATLLGLGGEGKNQRLNLTFRFENTSNVSKYMEIEGLSFDNVFFNKATGPITIPPQTIVYKTYTILADDLAKYQISSASSVRIWVSHMQFATLQGGGGFSKMVSYTVQLSKHGAKVPFQNGSVLLYQDDAVRLYLQKAQKRQYDGYEWICTMVNTGNKDFMLGSTTVSINGYVVDTESLYASVSTPHDTCCPAGQTTVFSVTYYGDASMDLKVIFTPQFYNVTGEELLYEGTAIVLEN